MGVSQAQGPQTWTERHWNCQNTKRALGSQLSLSRKRTKESVCSAANMNCFCRISRLRWQLRRTDSSKTESKNHGGHFHGKQDPIKAHALLERESCQHLPCRITEFLRTRVCFVFFLFSFFFFPLSSNLQLGLLLWLFCLIIVCLGCGGEISCLFSSQVSRPWTVSRQQGTHIFLFSTSSSGTSYGCLEIGSAGTSYGCLEIGRGGSIHIKEFNWCYKSGLFSPRELVVKYVWAHHHAWMKKSHFWTWQRW